MARLQKMGINSQLVRFFSVRSMPIHSYICWGFTFPYIGFLIALDAFEEIDNTLVFAVNLVEDLVHFSGLSVPEGGCGSHLFAAFEGKIRAAGAAPSDFFFLGSGHFAVYNLVLAQ